jgi:cupin fold WbuC family metalloprotein
MKKPNRLAFPNPTGDLFHLTDEMIEAGLRASRESSRLRMILPIHRKQEAGVQRLINFLQPGTYIRPHRHPLNHATESIVLMKGRIRFFTFDGDGNVTTCRELRGNLLPSVIDIEPRVWHSFQVFEEDTILFECKCGPYNAKTDKEFADWAPEEGSTEAAAWMKNLTS